MQIPGAPAPPLLRQAAVCDDRIDQSVVDGLLARHEIVTIGIGLDSVERLTRMLGEDMVEAIPYAQDLPGMDVDIRCLTLEATEGLVDHDPRMRQAMPFTLGAARQQ